MDAEDKELLSTVMDVVTRYGMKRTTMADLARGAGVSRQTLYDRFGDKDGIMAASILFFGDTLCSALKADLAAARTLGDKIDLYYQHIIYPGFRLLQKLPDAKDMEKGMGPASVAATKTAEAARQELLANMFRPHLTPDGQAPENVAEFFDQSSYRAKQDAVRIEDLERFLSVLKSSILALATQ